MPSVIVMFAAIAVSIVYLADLEWIGISVKLPVLIVHPHCKALLAECYIAIGFLVSVCLSNCHSVLK